MDSKTVLLVDDDPGIRRSLSRLLRMEGFEILEAGDGAEALVVLRSKSAPCAILLDMMMPHMNGWDFLEEQRKDPALAALPVVILSANPQSRESPMGPPTVAVMDKPVDFDRLVDLIKKACHS